MVQYHYGALIPKTILLGASTNLYHIPVFLFFFLYHCFEKKKEPFASWCTKTAYALHLKAHCGVAIMGRYDPYLSTHQFFGWQICGQV